MQSREGEAKTERRGMELCRPLTIHLEEGNRGRGQRTAQAHGTVHAFVLWLHKGITWEALKIMMPGLLMQEF